MPLEPCHIVVLAAGASRRMGRPKQTLHWPAVGKTLLQHTVDTAEATQLPVTVVLGAHAAAIEDQTVLGHRCQILYNPDWKEGMASSIRAAVAALRDRADTLLFCVCDQPYLSTDHLLALLAAQPPSGWAASRYGNGAWGVPLLAHRSHYDALLTLHGDVGAKAVATDVVFMDFLGGEVDVDWVGDIG